MGTIQKPVYVQGYVRNKIIKTKNEPDLVFPMVVLGCLAVAFIIAFWQFILLSSAASGVAMAAYKYQKYLRSPDRLVVNRYDLGPAESIWHNIKGMIQEG
jgi:hypothetical protein